MDLSVVPYEDKRSDSDGRTAPAAAAAAGGPGGGAYRECMRNHAAAIGGQAYDGCGEFMPGGEGGSIEALKCAACGCHRNFHRRDGPSGLRPLMLAPPPVRFPGFVAAPPLAAAYGQIRGFGTRAGSETPPRAVEEERRRKRCRTRFTAEQKEKMQAFAEKLGWRINKHDDEALQEFCVEVGIKRHVLKVWIHNNKNTLQHEAGRRCRHRCCRRRCADQCLRSPPAIFMV